MYNRARVHGEPIEEIELQFLGTRSTWESSVNPTSPTDTRIISSSILSVRSFPIPLYIPARYCSRLGARSLDPPADRNCKFFIHGMMIGYSRPPAPCCGFSIGKTCPFGGLCLFFTSSKFDNPLLLGDRRSEKSVGRPSNDPPRLSPTWREERSWEEIDLGKIPSTWDWYEIFPASNRSLLLDRGWNG